MMSKPDESNVLTNASFEEVEALRGWYTKVWKGKGDFLIQGGGRENGVCVVISSEEGGDLTWSSNVVVKPYSVYCLSGWIKTENVELKGGAGALLNIQAVDKTEALTGTHDWTRVEVTFETGPRDEVMVNCLLGGWGLATGTAWFDDLSLSLVSTEEFKPKVSIDTSEIAEPISKYVYGQFIEHLGKCIYGGIWAEMLEDRKFFDPVGASGSPWRAVGDPGRVKMVEEDAYVGRHTPTVQLAGDGSVRGIAQGGLGVVAGKAYEGRVVLAGDASAGPVQVSLVWGDGADERETAVVEKVSEAFEKTPFSFTAGASTKDARLEIVSTGKGTLRIGTASIMPADNIHGMRRDTLALLKELDSPVYRWPGGNFVSGYDWRDGIGERDRRPPRKNPAWKGIEHNDFGLDEYMIFCRELGTEAFITVNSGLGNVDEALAELEYANGGADTPLGKLRAANGHEGGYGVKWWAIGNEMYGGWQLGQVPLENYTKKHNEFAEAMRAADPSVKLIAVGATGPWSEGMLTHCADHMDLLSEHFYCKEKPGLMSHVRQIPDAVRHKAKEHRRYHKEIAALQGKMIPIALDEWNYWYGPELYGQIGTRYFLKDALGIAAGLHEYFRNSDVFFMANYAQTVNVIGAIKTNKTAAEFDTTGLVLKLYRNRYGVKPVAVSGDPKPLDVAAALSEDGATLTVGVVNATFDEHRLELEVPGADSGAGGTVWTIRGDDPMDYNEPGVPPEVLIAEEAAGPVGKGLVIPPLSIQLYAFPLK